ncbi:TonB-dependent siderophore receptor [Azospirillum sp. ST 5-10]|uniref:TonB-dependent siderophore receptor n=1 Tax=unclassified Azospirillum TaxID=2630922 RepID=UPI003F49D14D
MGFGQGAVGGASAGRVVVAACLGAVLAGGLLPAARAQDGPQDGPAVATARRVGFDIPAGPLADVLAALGRQARLQIAYAPDTVAGRQSAGLRATATPEEALRTVLADTGIAWRFTGPASVTLLRPTDGAMTLDPVTVEGQGGPRGGRGAADDYVAGASATGTKTDTPLLEIPQSVSVVTAKELERRGADDLNDALAYTPGVRVVDYPGGPGAPDVYMRGFRDSGLFSLYRDGLRASFNPYDTTVEPYGLDRIDVLKGPSSVLFGQATPGGLVNLTTKRPTETPLHEIQLQGGSFDRRQAAADLGGPLDGEGRWLYRLTALGRDSGTQIDHAPDDRVYVAPALTVRPTDRTRLTLLASYLDLTLSGAEQSIPMVGSLYDNPKGRIGTDVYFGEPGLSEWNVRNESIGYEVEHAFSDDWSVRQNARYLHTDADFRSAYPNTWPVSLVDGRYYPIGIQERPKETRSILIDTAVEGRVATGPVAHALLAGVDYGTYWGKESRRNSLNEAVIDIFDPVYGVTDFVFGDPWVDAKSSVDQVGVYLQDQLRFGRWVVTLGGRHDWVRNEETDYLAGTKQSSSDHEFTGRAGVVHLFDNGLAPYASVATSFQPTSGTYAPERGGGMFKPTTGTQYEVGLKYQPAGWTSVVTVSLYHLTQRNVVTNDPLYSGFSVQEGEVRSRGVEVEGKMDVTEELSLVASYAFTDAEITEDNPAAGSAASNVGLTPSAVPRHTAALWADYTFASGPLRGLGLGAGVRYVGGSYNASNTVKVSDYTLFDAALRYDLGALRPDLAGASIAVNATNLTDTVYETPGFYEDTVFYGNRRQILATLTYRW